MTRETLKNLKSQFLDNDEQLENEFVDKKFDEPVILKVELPPALRTKVMRALEINNNNNNNDCNDCNDCDDCNEFYQNDNLNENYSEESMKLAKMAASSSSSSLSSVKNITTNYKPNSQIFDVNMDKEKRLIELHKSIFIGNEYLMEKTPDLISIHEDCTQMQDLLEKINLMLHVAICKTKLSIPPTFLSKSNNADNVKPCKNENCPLTWDLNGFVTDTGEIKNFKNYMTEITKKTFGDDGDDDDDDNDKNDDDAVVSFDSMKKISDDENFIPSTTQEDENEEICTCPHIHRDEKLKKIKEKLKKKDSVEKKISEKMLISKGTSMEKFDFVREKKSIDDKNVEKTLRSPISQNLKLKKGNVVRIKKLKIAIPNVDKNKRIKKKIETLIRENEYHYRCFNNADVKTVNKKSIIPDNNLREKFEKFKNFKLKNKIQLLNDSERLAAVKNLQTFSEMFSKLTNVEKISTGSEKTTPEESFHLSKSKLLSFLNNEEEIQKQKKIILRAIMQNVQKWIKLKS